VSNFKVRVGLGPASLRRYSPAKDEALDLTVAVEAGRDPLLERRISKTAKTFAAFAKRYIAEHAQRNARAGERSGSTEEAERLLRAGILPVHRTPLRRIDYEAPCCRCGRQRCGARLFRGG
jgi:hypothetical protein